MSGPPIRAIGYSPYNQNPISATAILVVFAPADQLYGLGPVLAVDGRRCPGTAAAGQCELRCQRQSECQWQWQRQWQRGQRQSGTCEQQSRALVPHAVYCCAQAPAGCGGRQSAGIAWKFITYGDAHFGNQKYNDALERYRSAARNVPDWARPVPRRIRPAAWAKTTRPPRRCVTGWRRSPTGRTAISASARSTAATRRQRRQCSTNGRGGRGPAHDGDLAFVLGVHLYCDGKPDRLRRFSAARPILGTDSDVKPFCPKEQ